MPEEFYIRRGMLQRGPVSKDRVIAAFKAGSLQPADEIANSSHGPWTTVGEALGRPPSEVPFVEAFTLKKSLLGGHYVAAYECIYCRASLQSDESEWTGIERCPTCGKRYRISPQAAHQAAAKRRQLMAEKAANQAAAAKARVAKQAAREATAARKAEETRLASQYRQQQDAEQQAAETRAIKAANAARRRSGACWYCGQPCGMERPQCPFCMMLVSPSPTSQTSRNR
jgi:hypothetical protein